MTTDASTVTPELIIKNSEVQLPQTPEEITAWALTYSSGLPSFRFSLRDHYIDEAFRGVAKYKLETLNDHFSRRLSELLDEWLEHVIEIYPQAISCEQFAVGGTVFVKVGYIRVQGLHKCEITERLKQLGKIP